MTSLPVEVLLCIESSTEPRSITLLQPYKILERFSVKLRNYTNSKKDPRFFETPCKYRGITVLLILAKSWREFLKKERHFINVFISDNDSD